MPAAFSVRRRAGADGQAAEGVRYGYDAARTPIRLAESCDPADRALAARLVPMLQASPGPYAIRQLDGTPVGGEQSPVAAVGIAAAQAAAGDEEAARASLRDASRIQAEVPTYYGAAWVALGQILLTDRSLEGCPPLG